MADFDTLKLVDALEEANFPREQARAIVAVVDKARDAADLASRCDLFDMEQRLMHENNLLRNAVQAQGAALHSEMQASDEALRSEMQAQGAALQAQDVALRSEMQAQGAALRSEMQAGDEALHAKIDLLSKDMHAMENRLIIKLSVIMAGMMAFFGAVLALVNKLI